MAIYTMMGSEVEIVDSRIEGSDTWVTVRYIEDGEQREFHIGDLRADGGFNEIEDKVDNVQFAKDCAEEERRSFYR